MTLGILLALWSARAGGALITGLNIVYGEAEKRGFIRLNFAIGFLLTLGLIGAARASALIVIVAVPVVLQFLPLGSLSSAASEC